MKLNGKHNHMKKIALFLVSVLLVLGGATGQNGNSTGRFEWVRGYAPGNLAGIVGAVTDSVGNLYILGSFNFESQWENGELIMPITPHNGAQNGVNTLIAKISPEGEMVWKKVIHGNACPSQPHDIKPLGDTAFACLVTMPLAAKGYGYLYYLDTLVEATPTLWPDYPMSAEGFYNQCLALITFDFEGNVLEHHFLQLSYLDHNGEDIYYVNPPQSWGNVFLSTQVPLFPSFAIDSESHVYLIRTILDNTTDGSYSGGDYYLYDGDITAVKFWCDRRMVGVVPTDSTLYGSPQILKFAPHFDTLLENRNVFLKQSSPSVNRTHIRMDRTGNLYVIGLLEGNDSSCLVVDSIRNIYIERSCANDQKGYLIKFDSLLTAKSIVTLNDSIIPSDKIHSRTMFKDITFDYDSNLMFLCASTGRGAFHDTLSFYSILTYQGSPLVRLKNDAFMMSFQMNDSAQLHSYGRVPSMMHSSIRLSSVYEHDNIVCQNNRTIIQAIGIGGFRFPNQVVNFPRWSDRGLGFVVFDYQGNVIEGHSYSAISPDNEPGPMVIKDSILYLINQLSSDATFGDIQVPSRGDYFACIAKYVDTSFMTPYVRRVTEDTTIKVEVVQEEWTRVLYPNPTSGRVTVVMNGRPLRELYVAEMDGIAEPLPFSALGDGRYAADLTGRPDGVYVLVMISDDKHAYRSTVILQR